MSDIESLRPLLRGIEELNWQRLAMTLPPGERAIWKPNKAGWLIDWTLVATNPAITIEHNFWGQKITYTITQAYTYYLGVGTDPPSSVPNPAFNWISKWDAVLSLYSIVYTPRPYDYYTDQMYIEIINNETTPITIVGVNVHYLNLLDEAEYKESLREIFAK